ncbi:MAG: GNAT family protein [Candidatus Dormiibacterota bacterium]
MARPRGEPLQWSPRPRPDRDPLVGARVRLEPLDAAAHAPSLWAALGPDGGDPGLWDYLPYGPDGSAGQLRARLAEQARSTDPLFFAVVDHATARVVGVVSYLRINPVHGVIEIGHLLFAPPLQQTAGATEAIWLLAHHVFDDLGYRRLEWKCDALNARSRRAAERFGFTFEGIFRQAAVVKGRNRDTAWFALLDREWPVAGAAFAQWLAPENFDAGGRQRRSLVAIRAGG